MSLHDRSQALWLIPPMLLAVHVVATLLYRITFRALAKFPGPNLSKLTGWSIIRQAASGVRHIETWKEHQQYGSVVRIAPNTLSFNTASALNAIYSNDGRKANGVHKADWYRTIDAGFKAFSTHSEIDRSKHARRRRIVDRAFSDSAIAAAEEYVLNYIKVWVQCLYQRQKKAAAAAAGIIPELAELGVYARSVKPSDDSWFAASKLTNGPHDPLINLSETGLIQHMPKEIARIARNNAEHLMGVYPMGSRISSANLKPVPFWGVGSQICALNWQTFGASMQLNEALFSGSDGYVLKPAALRAGGNGKLSTGQMRKLHLQIGGATDVPVPSGRDADEIKPYISRTLVHPDELEGKPPKRKTKAYKHHKISGMLHGDSSPVTDPIWDETLEWECEENELVFLRILLKSDDSLGRNPVFAVSAVRLSYVAKGRSFIRLLDLKGRETICSLLVKFHIDDL